MRGTSARCCCHCCSRRSACSPTSGVTVGCIRPGCGASGWCSRSRSSPTSSDTAPGASLSPSGFSPGRRAPNDRWRRSSRQCSVVRTRGHAYLGDTMSIETKLPAGIDLRAEIDRLRKERNAVILAHYYQKPELQDLRSEEHTSELQSRENL